ncbi:MAG: response regulator, partial [Muribaculaceae bacterium]|nr:response regulator [Muribaculaceae bacterium]
LRFCPETSQIIPLPGSAALANTPINTIMPLQHTDKLLIGTRGHGPQLFDKSNGNLLSITGRFNLTKIPSVDVTAAFLDNESNLWFGTFDKGVFRIPARDNVFNCDNGLIDAFRDHFVTRIQGDDRGRFWIGTRYRGLALYNPSDGSTTYFSPKAYPWLNAFPTKFVQELFIDSAGRLWVGMDNGLFVCSLSDGPFLHNLKTFPRMGNVVTIAEDSRHRVWVGSSDGGIRIFNSDLTELAPDASPLFASSNITRLMPYDSDTMLAASYLENIYLVDIETLTATSLDSHQQSQWDTAIDVYRARNGHLWIGTYDNGLLAYDPRSRQLRHFTDFRSHDILAISEDADGNIWCCSSYGIYRIDPETARINTYLKHDGITGNQYHEKCSFTDKDGNIYFGGNYGLQQVIPANVDGIRRNIPIYLTELNTLNKKPDADDDLATTDLPFLKRLDLDYNNNALSIGFTGLNYDARMEYAYMLEGFDKMWIFPGEYNHAIYSNLPAGNYRFLVKVKENDTWSDATQLLEVNVAEAPWLHPLAKIGYVIFIVLLIIMLTQLYIRLRLEKERLTLAEKQMEDERLMSQRKLNFFNNISHELRTPITLIYAPVKFLRRNFRQMPQQEVESSLEYIDKNVDRLLTLTTQILKFRTIQGESLPLQVQWHDPVMQLDNIIRLYNIYAAEKDLSVNFTTSHQSIKAVYDADKLEKIINNLLFNAVKYTPPKGHITVRFEITNHPEGAPDTSLGTYMEIQVIDDGVGIPAEERKTIFTRFRRFFNPFTNRKEGGFGIGLNFVKHLVVKHHGVITYRPNAVKGTTFIVDIPVEASAYTQKEWAPESPDTPAANPTDHEAVPTIITQPKCPAPDKGGSGAGIDPADAGYNEPGNNGEPAAIEEAQVEVEVEEEPARHKILVVEDKKEMAEFIASVFSSEADVTIAADGHSGMQKAVEELPDVIISDIMMPLMTGYEMLSRIKNEAATCHIPVVLLTAKSRDEDKIKGYDTGADLYMEKPFNPEVLHSAVNSILAKLERQKHQVVQMAGTAETPPADEMAPLDRKFLTRLYAYINDNIGNSDLNVNLLGRELGFSRTNFYRKIKALTGVTPNDLLRVCRLNRAAQLLLTREYTIGEISDMTGFGTQSHFSNLFKRQFGVTPRDYLLNHTSTPAPQSPPTVAPSRDAAPDDNEHQSPASGS